jgi:hypothetical protein
MNPAERGFKSEHFQVVAARFHVVGVYFHIVALYFHPVAEYLHIVVGYIDIVAVLLLFTTWITFTELTIVKNHFVSSGGTNWQFGQVRSIIIPIVATL